MEVVVAWWEGIGVLYDGVMGFEYVWEHHSVTRFCWWVGVFWHEMRRERIDGCVNA